MMEPGYITMLAGRLSVAMLLMTCSCANDQTPGRKKNALPADTSAGIHQAVPETAVPPPDTIGKWIADDYPVTDTMFGYKGARIITVGGAVSSSDKAWFSNDTLQQTLVFELYTDYHRMVTFHFANNDIPRKLISTMELHVDGSELADDRLKEKYFKGFLDSAQRISSSYFTTDKGFRLGDDKEKCIKAYGKPDSISASNGVEKYVWDYVGDALYDDTVDLKGKRLAKDSYGHHVMMFFRKNKLTGIILHNDIP